MTAIRVGSQVKIVDPTRVVAFTRNPNLWTAAEYRVVSVMTSSVVGVRSPKSSIVFPVSVDNLTVAR